MSIYYIKKFINFWEIKMKFYFDNMSLHSYMMFTTYRHVTKGTDCYLVPILGGLGDKVRHLYDIYSKIDNALVTLLNIGKLCLTEENIENEKNRYHAARVFVEQYGFLGFMIDMPANPNFLLDKYVILKKDNMI